MKSTLHLTTKVLTGNRIEIESPTLLVGQTVEVVVFIADGSTEWQELMAGDIIDY